jgi:hypothetical protein
MVLTTHLIMTGIVARRISPYKKHVPCKPPGDIRAAPTNRMNQELPKLPPKASKAFKVFVGRANKGLLHQLDWERFYRFVSVCRATRVTLSEDDVYRLLRSEGFSQAKHISSIFYHLNNFARLR